VKGQTSFPKIITFSFIKAPHNIIAILKKIRLKNKD